MKTWTKDPPRSPGLWWYLVPDGWTPVREDPTRKVRRYRPEVRHLHLRNWRNRAAFFYRDQDGRWRKVQQAVSGWWGPEAIVPDIDRRMGWAPYNQARNYARESVAGAASAESFTLRDSIQHHDGWPGGRPHPEENPVSASTTRPATA